MSNSVPFDLIKYFFTKLHIESVPKHSIEDSLEQVDILPTNDVSVLAVPEKKDVYMVQMKCVYNPERLAEAPYFMDIEAVAFFQVKEKVEEAELRKGILIVGHQILYGAIREAVAFNTSRQAFDQFTLGISMLDIKKKPTEKPESISAV